MPHTHTTIETAENLLAGMLSDLQGSVSKIRWVSAELQQNIFEALRMWQSLTGMWEAQTDPITLSANTAWLDIPSSTSLRAYTLRDQSLISQIQYHLFEPSDPIDGTGMTGMWTFAEIVAALQRRRDQFLLETRCRLTRSVLPAAPDLILASTYELPDTAVDLIRAAWVDVFAGSKTRRLSEISAFSSRSSRARILQEPGVPHSFTAENTPFALELTPGPASGGRLDLLTIDSGAALDPTANANTGVLLGIPDDFAWVVKWGALADLLAKDGVRDYARALFCERRYRMGVAAALMSGSVTDAAVAGRHVHMDRLEMLDAGRPYWQSQSGRIDTIAAAGLNLLAIAYPPKTETQVQLTVARNAPIPSAGEYLQVGRDQLDLFLGYAAHLCMFKIGGAEFAASTHLADNYLEAAVERNEKLRGSAMFAEEKLGAAESDAKARGLRRVTGGSVEAGATNESRYGTRN